MVPEMKRTKRTLVYEGKIVTMYEDDILMPDGKKAKWDFIEHKKGAAAVVAVKDNGKILLVRQYRNALDRLTLELPAGARDTVEEDTLVCAMRELEEETGFYCEKIEKLLSLKSTVAFCNELIDVYLATELKPGKQQLDEEEFIEVEEHDLEELLTLIYQGKIQDAKTVAGILAYANIRKEE